MGLFEKNILRIIMKSLFIIAVFLISSFANGQSPTDKLIKEMTKKVQENTPVVKPQNKCTVELKMEGVIGLSNQQRLVTATRQAKKNNCDSILVLINTPGGSLDTTRRIVTQILNSEIPVLCLVYPSGAHAGSAGAIIMQACHVNGAMKATNIGAATPVSGGGQDVAKDLRKKLLNDTVSWLEGITRLRKRNVEFSKEIVTEAKAVSATDAHKIKAIDFVGNTKQEFLSFAHGREVLLKDSQPGTVAVGLLKPINEGVKEKAMDLLADPQLAYMMFMASLGLLYFELTHPGMIAPGVVGAVGLVISMVSLHKLDVQWGALILILLGLAFLVAEAFVPSFGMLGIGGGVSLVIGSIFLFDQQATGHSIPLTMILPIAILFTLISLYIARLALRSRNKAIVNNESLITSSQGVIVDVKNNGEVWALVMGERWLAMSDDTLSVGDKVQVLKQNNLKLTVKKI